MRLSAGWFITARNRPQPDAAGTPAARRSHMIEAAGNGNSRSHLTRLAKAGRVREEEPGGRREEGRGADGSDSAGLEVASLQE